MSGQPADRGGFAGKVALVTGGGSGIGRATALGLAQKGASVMVVGRRADAVKTTAASHENIQGEVGDVGVAADIERVVGATVAAFGRLDLLVNNAGFVVPTPVAETNVDDAMSLWTTNVLGPTLLAKAALPHLSQDGGAIVNVSSSFAHKPAPGMSHYGASKAALEQLTRSWALELAGSRVRVNAIAPGPTESEALERSGLTPELIEQVKESERNQIPLGRRGEPAEVAWWIIALADPAASWVTGVIIDVDGGFSLS